MVTAPRSNAKHLHSTAKGFKTPPTEEQIIQQMVKKSRLLGIADVNEDIFSPSYVSELRNEWLTEWNGENKKRPYTGSKATLLDPSYSFPLEIWCPKEKNRLGYRTLHRGVCGRWMVETAQHDYNIDISIKCLIPDDDGVPFAKISPITIQRFITKSLGYSTYKKWKQLQLDDLPSLRRLINEFRDVIDYPCMSMTCCEKSKRLCERVGLPIYKDYTFLIPNSMVS
ncbi:hypothetical protein SynBOUM118_02312 [Synechococcus sp. BOUM118]|nr:hypothetical protein SynBOUM118_02312 [Synechococcus sp. BOUM118]